MIYLDTSALIPYFVVEPQSPAIEQVLLNTRASFHLSWWTQVEFASALSKNVRMKLCTAQMMADCLMRLDEMIPDFLSRWSVVADDFKIANSFLTQPKIGLRAGDALHLAIAKNHGAELLTLDDGLLKAAHHFKIPARTI